MKSGYSKKDIFEYAKQKGYPLKQVAKMLAKYPDGKATTEYHKDNNILVTVYSILVGLGLLFEVALSNETSVIAKLFVLFFASIIPGLILYFLILKRPFAYLSLAAIMLLGVLLSLTINYNSVAQVLIELAINLGILIFAVNVKRSLFPFQNIWHTKCDQDGLRIFMNRVPEDIK